MPRTAEMEFRWLFIEEGLAYCLAELIILLIAYLKPHPFKEYCDKPYALTPICRNLNEWLSAQTPPLYIALLICILPIIIMGLIRFIFSFFDLDNVADKEDLRPLKLIAFFTVMTVASIIIIFAFMYEWSGIYESGKHVENIWKCIYFSVITITTVGYGDYSPDPSSTSSYIIAASEALTGYFILGVLVSSLSIMFHARR